MKIIIKPHYSYFYNVPERIFKFANDFYKERVDGYYWMPAYKSGRWDGFYRFVKKLAKYENKNPDDLFAFKLPTGLLKQSKKLDDKFWNVIKNEEFIFNLDKENILLEKPIPLQFQLRDYQKRAVFLSTKQKRGIINLATNAGKTEVAIAIMRYFKNGIFIVHRGILARQIKERIENRLNIPVGLFGTGKKDLDKDFIVATIQSLNSFMQDSPLKFKKWASRFVLVFWDEVHHLKSDTWYSLSFFFVNAYFRYGLTATLPDKRSLNFMKLVAATGPVVYSLDQKYLVEKGYSSLPFIYTYKYKEVELDRQYFLDYQGIVEYYINKNKRRNRIVIKFAEEFNKFGKKVIILVDKVKHGEELNKIMKDAVLLTGRQSAEYRMQLLNSFKVGKIKTLIVTNWFDEGMDVPEIDVLILASGGKSDRAVIQRMGRAMRRSASKTKVVIIDILDTNVRYLSSHSKRRLEILKSQGFEVKMFDKFRGIVKTIKQEVYNAAD